MIAFFPEPYSDELVYSWFSRYAVRTGYTHYRAVAEDLFVSNTAKPNLEFIMELNKDAYKVITRYKPFKEIIINHTMFPYYARFLSKERRLKAYKLLLKMDKRYNDALYSRKNKTQCRQSLRFCPICAEEDRDTLGETYWHRIHQLDHIDICPVHGCYLYNSTVDITSRSSPSLISAEEVVPLNSEKTFSENELELKVARYIMDLFLANLDVNNDVLIGKFLHSKMEYTKYLSARGEIRYLTLLFNDFQSYYRNLPNLTITEAWQIEKIFTKYQFHTYDIGLLAYFLKIPVSELTKMRLPKKTQVEKFDKQILRLHSQGLNYREISERVGTSYDYCKVIATRARLRNNKIEN